jgi:hypothetical protein
MASSSLEWWVYLVQISDSRESFKVSSTGMNAGIEMMDVLLLSSGIIDIVGTPFASVCSKINSLGSRRCFQGVGNTIAYLPLKTAL